MALVSSMNSRRELVKEVNPSGVKDTIYVAVAKDVKDSKLNVIWAIQNSGGKSICILHVHVPAAKIPMSKSLLFDKIVCIRYSSIR